MTTLIKIHEKPFNPDGLLFEIQQTFGLPLTGLGWAGFNNAGPRLYVPFPETSKKIGEQNNIPDIALKGELRLDFDPDLIPADEAILDTILDDHLPSNLTPEQQRENQDDDDLVILRAAFDNPANLTDADLKLMLRVLLRFVDGQDI